MGDVAYVTPDSTHYEVVEDGGRKWIHYMSFSWSYDDSLSDDDIMRVREEFPSTHIDENTEFIVDEEIDDLYLPIGYSDELYEIEQEKSTHYYNFVPVECAIGYHGSRLRISEVTEDTPCGEYWE